MSSETEKIKRDIREKGFSYVDEEILKKIENFVDELNKDPNAAGKVVYKNKKIGSDVYFIYDEMHFEPVQVISVVDYLFHVLKYEDENVNRYFRGQKAHYDLLPSLFRDNGKYVEKEMELNAKVYNDRPEDFADCHSTFEKLVRLKHFVHASRLIDISSSPLVALYFACTGSSLDKEVGVVMEVYCRKEDEKFSVSSDTVVMLTAMTNTKLNLQGNKNKDFPSLPCISNNKSLNMDTTLVCPKANGNSSSCYLRCWPNKVIKNKNNKGWRAKNRMLEKDSWANRYIGELSHQCKKEGMVIYWDDLCFNELNQCILVKPPLNNDRIVRQQGSFIMCGMNPKNIRKPPESLYKFFRYPELQQINKPGGEDNPAGAVSSTKRAKFYYILPEDRRFILEELKLFGMDDYYFFPELEKEIDVVKASVKKKELTDEEKKKEEERLNDKERWKGEKTEKLKELLKN